MKKKLIQRGLLGFPLGIAIGFVITIFISIGVGQGNYYAVRPELMDVMGGELNAVILQTVLCGIMGSCFAMASVIWDIAYVTNWMEHTMIGILSYVGIFVAIFISVWLIQYFIWKMKIKRMNERVHNRSEGEDQ